MKKITTTNKDIFWKEDPSGFVTIKPFPEEQVIRVRFYKNHQLQYLFTGTTPQQLYYKIITMGLISRMEHAAYLGKELEKAYLAMKYNLYYVQDDELNVEKKAESEKEKRIVSLAPSNTEILYALEVGKNIIATTRFCDYPSSAKKKENVGGWLDVDFLKIKKMNPDLVLTSTFVQNKVVEDARKYNLNVVHLDPTHLDEVYNSILIIGELVKKKEEAGKIINDMKKNLQEIKKKKIPGKIPKIYIEEWHKPPTASGNWVPELVEIAGGKYGLCRKGERSREIKTEEIQKFNPDIIFLSLCGFGSKAYRKIIMKRPGWERVAAVKSKQVFVINDSLLNRPGPRLVKGAEFLLKKINEWKKKEKSSK